MKLLSVIAALLLAIAVEAQEIQVAKTTLWVTPNILTGFLAGLVWITIFLSGFCCLFSLQTPAFFPEKGLVLNKEY